MKVTVGNKIYDSEAATKLAAKPTQSSCQELHQTAAGDFFLFTHQVFVDGNRLGPNELWIDLNSAADRRSRLTFGHEIIPLTHHEALVWCVKTQIPETLRGYVLDCI